MSQAAEIYRVAKAIMADAGMNLHKWATNSAKLQGLFEDDNILERPDTIHKVPGLRWRPENDLLYIPTGSALSAVRCNISTKRTVLQASARIVDPLRIFSPFIIRVKILFRRLWETAVDWDSALPDHLEKTWCDKLLDLQRLTFKRCVTTRREIGRLEMHVFCDASPEEHGACAYLRMEDGNYSFNAELICAKSRVAPLKRLSLTMLELRAALIGVRLPSHVCQQVGLSATVLFRTDSTIALHWIQSYATKWKAFVQNRVSEIHSLSAPQQCIALPWREREKKLMTGREVNQD